MPHSFPTRRSSDLRRRPSYWCVIRRLVVAPVGACRHDDLVALLFPEAIYAQHAALVLGALPSRPPATTFGALIGDQLVGPAVSKVADRLSHRPPAPAMPRHRPGRYFGHIV